MAPKTPKQCYHAIWVMYRDAHKVYTDIDEMDPTEIVGWADTPRIEKWAEFAVRHHGWSWFVCEGVVRKCRSNVNRAKQYVEELKG